MSELKAYRPRELVMQGRHNEPIYLKSEADKVIAELKKKLTAAQQAQPDVRTQTLGGESSEGGKMKTLTLSLKKQWFDMIKAGIKKEEYREICDYWGVRFAGRDVWANEFCIKDVSEIALKHFDRLVFTLGYPKADDTERRLVFKNPKIRIGTGKPEWGAEPGKMYFVISWEE